MRRLLILLGTVLLSATGQGKPAPTPQNSNTQGPIRFEEIAQKAGLHYITANGNTENKNQPQTMVAGVALFDYDGDGYLDVYLVGGAALPSLEKDSPVYWNRLFHNNRNGTFTDVTEKAGLAGAGYGSGVAIGDYDNDGWPDVFLANVTGNQLFHNNGDGTFTDVSEETGIAQQFGKGMSVTFADYDGDGYLDAFVANDTTQNFLFHNLKGKKFEEVALLAGVGYAPDGIARSGMGADFRDVNNDGLPDIWHTAVEHEGFPLWLNEGKGEFQDMTVASGLAKTNDMSGWGNGIADFDNDGWKDLFVA